MTKILFILKRRLDYDPEKHSPKGLSTGLFNSASFMDQMLNDAGIESVLEVAIDNNCIDRLIRMHNPTHVIIEALWVVPSKFAVLTNLHPNIKWIIRLHSEMPFLAGEGIAMNWIGDYAEIPNMSIGINAPRLLDEMRTYLKIKQGWSASETVRRVFYMPNFYPQTYSTKRFDSGKSVVDVGCFGAIRPLKNQLLQAFAAISFADKIGKKLRFHINSGRIEMKGDPVMSNLRGLFQQLAGSGHQMIGHEWRPRAEFLELCAKMDIGLQVSFSETFNIVGADLISQGIPLVGSDEIPWSSKYFNASATESRGIAKAMLRAYRFPQLNVWHNQCKLTAYTNKTRSIWINYFMGDM